MARFRSRPLASKPLRSPAAPAPRRNAVAKSLSAKGRPLGGKRAPIGRRNLLVAASPAQRDKVAGATCIVCGRAPADPAHIAPQRLGGCPDPACCWPLCRPCHRGWDAGGLDLRPYLGDDFGDELEHALTHVTAEQLERALSGGGWGPRRRRRER
jgi:hypothetical protein